MHLTDERVSLLASLFSYLLSKFAQMVKIACSYELSMLF